MKLLFSALFTIVVLEASLQMLAFGVWFFGDRGADSRQYATGDRVVLCMGDSFTAGFGAEEADGPYPVQLESVLRESTGDNWRVVKKARAGWTSRDLLERVDAALDHSRPELAYFIVGVNDTWYNPKELVLPKTPSAAPSQTVVTPAPGEAFRWELRTLRMIKTLSVHRPFQPPEDEETTRSRLERAQWLARYEPTTNTERPAITARFVGQWRSKVGKTTLRGDGTGVHNGLEILWKVEGGRFHARTLDKGTLAGTFEFDDNQLSIAWDQSDVSVRLARVAPVAGARKDLEVTVQSPGPAGLKIIGRTAQSLGDLPMAERMFTARIAGVEPGSDDEVLQRTELLGIRATLGMQQKIDQDLVRFEALLRQRGDSETWSHFVVALGVAGCDSRALDAARDWTKAYPKQPKSWSVLARLAFDQGQTREARDAMERTVALLPKEPGTPEEELHVAYAHLLRYRIHSNSDSTEALRSLMLAYWHCRDAAWHSVLHGLDQFDAVLVDEMMAKCIPDPKRRQEIEAMRTRNKTSSGALRSGVYRSHLRQLVERCRSAGCTPVFCSYPHRGGWYHEHARNIAQHTGAGWFDLHSKFQELLRAEPSADLFIADGHCNDAGYRFMAEAIARDVEQRAKNPR